MKEQTIKVIIIFSCLLGVSGIAGAQSLRRGENIMFNGSFDHEDDPLLGWTYNYSFLYQREATQFDSRHYELNHERVEVLPFEGGRRNVLRLVHNPPAGTKVDGPPIRIDPKGRYRLSVWGKSTGPDARVLMEGYYWRPGIRPHDNLPQLTELRRSFRTKPVYFGSTRDGNMSAPTRQWSRGVREFPDKDMSRPAQNAWNRVEFVILHVVAILGSRGELYINDVVLERIE